MALAENHFHVFSQSKTDRQGRGFIATWFTIEGDAFDAQPLPKLKIRIDNPRERLLWSAEAVQQFVTRLPAFAPIMPTFQEWMFENALAAIRSTGYSNMIHGLNLTQSELLQEIQRFIGAYASAGGGAIARPSSIIPPSAGRGYVLGGTVPTSERKMNPIELLERRARPSEFMAISPRGVIGTRGRKRGASEAELEAEAEGEVKAARSEPTSPFQRCLQDLQLEFPQQWRPELSAALGPQRFVSLVEGLQSMRLTEEPVAATASCARILENLRSRRRSSQLSMPMYEL